MLCPSGRVELNMAERQNIEVDYCPQCRGVWPDRGALDTIIERSQRDPRHGRKKSFLRELLDF